MSKLSVEDFMKSAKAIIGDRTDDDALKFLEDCKDTITDEKDDWKSKYEEQLEANKKLDTEWRQKYKDTFFSSDANNNNDNNDNTHNDPNFDTRSEAQKQAESITIADLFKPAE